MVALAILPPVVGVTTRAAHASGTARVMGMYTTPTPSASPVALPMLDSKLEVSVRGPIVETIVTQRFINRADRPIEATYTFPLPADAAVSAMSIRLGARTIHAAIEKRADAQRRYEDAVHAGVGAATLEQERPDVFTQTVAAIPAKGTIEVVLRYDALARYADGQWTLVLPMVVAPRYVPGLVSGRPTTGTGRAPDTDRVPDASRVTPAGAPQAGGPTRVTLHFADPVTAVTSPTHELIVVRGSEAAFTDPVSDHDAVIRWRATSPAAGWVEAGGPGSAGSFAAVVVEAPPAAARKGPTRAIVLLDRAATMRGDANAVAQPVVRALFGALQPADRVAVIGGAADRVTFGTPAKGLEAVEQTWTHPGSPLDLSRALAGLRPEGAALVLVSDGLVADDRAVLAAGKRLGVPIHVIGVGPAPARALLTQLAAITGGTVRFVLPADDLAAITRATVADVASAPAPLTVSWGTLVASDVVPGVLPRLGAGQAIVVLARVAKAQSANARARGELFALEAAPAGRVVEGATTSVGPLGRRWARERQGELVLAATERAPNVAAITAHALAFGLVSPYTSLVAIGDEVVVQGGVKHSVAVPVSVPAGMQWDEVRRETTLDFDHNLESKAGGKTQRDNVDTEAQDGKTTVDTTVTTKVADATPSAPVPPRPTTNKPDTKKPATRPDRKQPDQPRQPQAGAAAPPPPPAEPMDDRSASGAANAEAEDDGERDEGRAPSVKQVAATDIDERAYGVTGESTSLVMNRRGLLGRDLRLAAGVGGGLVREAGASQGLLALSLRLDYGRRASRYGLEGSLWLVDGLHGQGRLLLSYARLGVTRHLELGVGLGLELAAGAGAGIGPAASLSARLHLPWVPWLAGYLRYDGALVPREVPATTGSELHGQHTGSVGVEWGF